MKITIQKLQDSGEVNSKRPTHAIVASDDDFKNKVTVGKLWTRDGQYGKFLSGQLDQNKEIDGKKYKGYVLITEDEYNELKKKKVDLGEATDKELEEIF